MTVAGAVAVAVAAWVGALGGLPWTAAPVGIGVLAVLGRRAGRAPAVGDRPVGRPWRLAVVCIAVALVTGGAAGGRIELRDRQWTAAQSAVGSRAAPVEGRVATEWSVVDHRAWAVVRLHRVRAARVRVRAVMWADVPGGVSRHEDSDLPAVGAAFRAQARLRPLGDSGMSASLRARGVGGEVVPVGALRLVDGPSWPLRTTSVLRERLARAAEQGLDPDRASLLTGLVTGDDTARSERLDARLRAAGLSHLVVVSGRHTALFLAAVLGLCGLARLRYRASRWVAIGALAWFVVVVRWQPSVLRAGAVAVVMLGADLLGRQRDTVRVLAICVLVLLLLDPSLAIRPGFALSVAATAGVLVGVRLADEGIVLPRPLRTLLGAAVGAQIAVAPVLAVSGMDGAGAAAIPANLVAAPAAAIAQLIGAAAALVAPVSVAAAGVVAGAAGPALTLVLLAARLADAVSWAVVVGVAAVLVAVVARRRPTWRAATVGALVAVLLVVALGLPPPRDVHALTVTALDVGQGDALLVEAPRGRGAARMLVDAGPDPDDVADALLSRGVRSVDVALVSHPHADHVDGMAAVVERLAVGVVLIGIVTAAERGEALGDLLEASRRRGVAVREVTSGRSWRLGSATARVLWPPPELIASANDRSVVVRVESAGGSVLLTGDVEAAAQRRLLRDPAALAADVVKVPHHGGDTNATGFLGATGARLALVSVGRGNDFGHPTPAALAQVGEARVARTDHRGEVRVELGPRGLRLMTSRSPPDAAGPRPVSHRPGILRAHVEGGPFTCADHPPRCARGRARRRAGRSARGAA